MHQIAYQGELEPLLQVVHLGLLVGEVGGVRGRVAGPATAGDLLHRGVAQEYEEGDEHEDRGDAHAFTGGLGLGFDVRHWWARSAAALAASDEECAPLFAGELDGR